MTISSIRTSIIFHVLTFLSVKSDVIKSKREDLGTPLFLTPLIESGKTSEARQLAQVPFTDKLNVKSYAGLFTVDKKYNSNHFLWYFPAINSKSEDAPVLVWLQGGPGTTSLFGLFAENGPIEIRNGEFVYREINWATDYHLIYIDNPVGTGYSFTNDSRGYCNDQTQIAEQLYSTLIQFFKLFPELMKNPFFLTGESYAGKYLPSLAYTIQKKNTNTDLKINLLGISIGNGFSDPENQMDFHKLYLQLGLVDFNQAAVLEKIEKRIINLIKTEKWDEAYYEFKDLLLSGLRNTSFYKMTGSDSIYNFLDTKFDMNVDNFTNVVQNPSVRKDIHVGNLIYHTDSKPVNIHLRQDLMKSVAPIMEELLNHYCVLLYNGQMDLVVPYPMTVNYVRKLNYKYANEYENSNRIIWRVDDDVAGYIRRGGNLVEVLVRNAGHMVPMNQPKWAKNMINLFIDECINKTNK